MLLDNIDVEHTQRDDLLYRMIGIESIHAPMDTSVLVKIRNLMESSFNKVNEAFASMSIVDPLDYPTKAFNKFLKTHPYESLMDVSVFRPTGLTVSFLEAVKDIGEYHAEVMNIRDRLLTPFIKWAAEGLTDPTKLQNLTDGKPLSMVDVDLINEKLDVLYDVTDKSDKIPYSVVVKRNSDWPTLVKELRVLINRQNRLKLGKLRQDVNVVSDYVDMILKYCSENKDTYECSKNSRMKLADILYAVGREVSLVSRYHWAVSSLSTAVEDTVSKLLEMER